MSGPALITGGAGFIGANLADAIASMGADVLVYDNLSRPGARDNLAWLKRRHPRAVRAEIADVRDVGALAGAVAQASVVFHLAAQVAVTASLADPAEDFAVNVGGALILLEALRGRRDPPPLIFASTNKVYGDLADVALRAVGDAYLPEHPTLRRHGVDERRPLAFRTPYGCSKGAADQYVLDYAASFGLPAAVFRMSCIYGPRQHGVEDQGWLAHFLIRALSGRSVFIFGDGRQVRDVLDVRDVVGAYLAAWRRMPEVSGRAFNLGGGPDNAVSLRETLAFAERLLDRPVAVRFADWRAGDQRWYVSDARAARRALGLDPPRPWREGVAALAGWLAEEHPEVRGSVESFA